MLQFRRPSALVGVGQSWLIVAQALRLSDSFACCCSQISSWSSRAPIRIRACTFRIRNMWRSRKALRLLPFPIWLDSSTVATGNLESNIPSDGECRVRFDRFKELEVLPQRVRFASAAFIDFKKSSGLLGRVPSARPEEKSLDSGATV